MMRVVLDTNVIASGLATYRPTEVAPARILREMVDKAFAVHISEPMMAEVERTLDKPYFRARVPEEMRLAILAVLQREQAMTALTRQVSDVATHPEDDLVLATAVSARADYLVTGDRQLLRLGSFEGVAIISPADFLAVLAKQEFCMPDEPATF